MAQRKLKLVNLRNKVPFQRLIKDVAEKIYLFSDKTSSKNVGHIHIQYRYGI